MVRVRHLWPVIFLFLQSRSQSVFYDAWGVACMESVYGLPTTSASSYIAVILIGLMVGSLFQDGFQIGWGCVNGPCFSCLLNVAIWAILSFTMEVNRHLQILKPLFYNGLYSRQVTLYHMGSC